MTATALTRLLDDAGVDYLVVPDADIDAEGTTEQLAPLMRPFVEVTVYTVSGNGDQTLLAITTRDRDLNLAKVDAVLADRPVAGGATPLDGLERPELLAAWAERKWPVFVDEGVARARNHLRMPSGNPGESVVIYAQSLIEAMGARVEDIALPEELHREEPHFALYTDGIRSLDPDKSYLRIPPIEVYFDEVVQILSGGESEEYIDALHRTIAAAKRLLPKPSARDISAAHFAFLKER